MKDEVKTTKPFKLSLAAGILILTNAVLLGAASTWFPWIIPTLPGPSGNSNVPFGSLTVVGLICGTMVLLGAILLHSEPSNSKPWGMLIIGFSIPTVVMGGGFIIGFILGIMGGVLVFKKL